MLSLAIDTSTGISVALVASTGVIHELSLDSHGVQGEKTTALIGELLNESGHNISEVTDLVVGVGPGPFTGLRVGIATAQAFAFARHLPTVGICSLDAIGLSYESSCIVVTDARRKEVYWARYDRGRREGPAVATPDSLVSTHPDAFFIGPAVSKYQDIFDGVEMTLDAAKLVDVARSFPELHLPLSPLYLRKPDAVEPTTRKSVL